MAARELSNSSVRGGTVVRSSRRRRGGWKLFGVVLLMRERLSGDVCWCPVGGELRQVQHRGIVHGPPAWKRGSRWSISLKSWYLPKAKSLDISIVKIM